MKRLLKQILNKRFLILAILIGCFVLSGCNFKVDQDPGKAYDERNSSCWTCQFFGVIYRSLALISQNSAEMLCKASVSLMVAILALWLLYFLGKNFFWSMEEPDYRGVWASVFKAIGKATIVGIVLSSKDMFFAIVNMIYIPIVKLWLFFAVEILKIDTGSGGVIDTLKASKITTKYETGTAFPADLAQEIEMILYRVQVAFDIGMTIGIKLLATSDIVAILLAFFVMGSFFYLSITFPLYFIDAIIRFGFAIIVMPLALVAWALPVQGSAGVVRSFFNFIMGTGAQILIAAVFIAFSLSMMDNFLQERMGFKATASGQNINQKFVTEMIQFKSSGLLLFVMCFYLIKLSERVPSMAGKLTNTETGMGIMGNIIKTVKKGVVGGIALIAGFFTAGAGTAIALADKGMDTVGNVASGGSSGEGGS